MKELIENSVKNLSEDMERLRISEKDVSKIVPVELMVLNAISNASYKALNGKED